MPNSIFCGWVAGWVAFLTHWVARRLLATNPSGKGPVAVHRPTDATRPTRDENSQPLNGPRIAQDESKPPRDRHTPPRPFARLVGRLRPAVLPAPPPRRNKAHAERAQGVPAIARTPILPRHLPRLSRIRSAACAQFGLASPSPLGADTLRRLACCLVMWMLRE